MQAMLKENGPSPSGEFAELKFLEPVKEYRARHASTLLPFDAVVKAFEQSLEKAKNNCLMGMVKNQHLIRGTIRGKWRRTPGRVFGVAFVRLYQLTLSGFIGNSCRHLPTCSEYAYEAIGQTWVVERGVDQRKAGCPL